MSLKTINLLSSPSSPSSPPPHCSVLLPSSSPLPPSPSALLKSLVSAPSATTNAFSTVARRKENGGAVRDIWDVPDEDEEPATTTRKSKPQQTSGKPLKGGKLPARISKRNPTTTTITKAATETKSQYFTTTTASPAAAAAEKAIEIITDIAAKKEKIKRGRSAKKVSAKSCDDGKNGGEAADAVEVGGPAITATTSEKAKKPRGKRGKASKTEQAGEIAQEELVPTEAEKKNKQKRGAGGLGKASKEAEASTLTSSINPPSTPKKKKTTQPTSPEHVVANLTTKEQTPPAAPEDLQPNLPPPARRQWTPIKDTTFIELDSSSPSTTSTSEKKKSKSKSGFGELVQTMRYSAEATSSFTSATDDISRGATIVYDEPKRSIGTTDISKKAKKPTQKQKAKTNTITAQATAQYLSTTTATTATTSSVLSPITSYFPLQSKSKVTSKKTRKPLKALDPAPDPTLVLLSPNSARERINNQGFIFGTSSQLEKDENRDERQQQEEVEEDKFLPPASTSLVRRGYISTLTKDRKGDAPGGNKKAKSKSISAVAETGDVELLQQYTKKSKIAKKSAASSNSSGGGLWSAAARDMEGGLVGSEVEVVDMSGGLDQEPPITIPSSPRRASRSRSRTPAPVVVPFFEVESNPPSPLPPLPSRRSRKRTSVSPSPPAPRKKSPPPPATTTTAATTIDFKSYPTTKLQAAIAKFGFKPMKSRDAMIECLERCRDAQSAAAAGQNLKEAEKRGTKEKSPKRKSPPSTPPTPPSKKTKKLPSHSRSRSTSPSRTSYSTPTKKRVSRSRSPKKRTSRSRSRSRTTTTRPKFRRAPSTLSPGTQTLHKNITAAIIRHSSDQNRFYEKILMYDPIVLEDLVEWLNGEGRHQLLAGAEKEKVDLEGVRVWAERCGICCVLRGGRNGARG